MSDRTDHLEAIKEVVAFLETHPEVPIPTEFHTLNVWMGDKAQLASIARSIGSTTKRWVGEYFCLVKMFGVVSFEFNITRDQVCRRVVVGTRRIPSHTEEIVEWVCDEEEPIIRTAG